MSKRITKWMGLTVAAAVVASGALGCAQQPSATAAVVQDKTYMVTPAINFTVSISESK